ncbi:hypothetical protein N2152v2_009642 [Parachlorella kessleri]
MGGFAKLTSLIVASTFLNLLVRATHNSYHIAPREELLQKVMSNPLVKALLPESDFLPAAWEYTHLALDQQLDLGVRGFELDLHADPLGGLYAQAAGLRLAGVSGWLDIPELQEPGFKVLHVPDLDFNATCYTLKSCLAGIKRWSDAHPQHLPISIYMESKRPIDLSGVLGDAAQSIVKTLLASSTAPGPDRLLIQTPLLNTTLLADLEDEILAVFNRSSLVTPDDVRAGNPSVDLKELLLADPTSGPCPWPPLDLMRGKILFIMTLRSDGDVAMYEELHPNQEGALMWLVASRRSPQRQAVFYLGADYDIALDNFTLPQNASAIVEQMAGTVRSMVQQGYIVRARVDAETLEARQDYVFRRDALLAAGAHHIATDYPLPSQIFTSPYKVDAPGANYGLL